MRITLKMAGVTLAGIIVVLLAHGWITLRSQLANAQEMVREHHQVLGRALAAAVASAWVDAGEQGAAAVIEAADANQKDVRLRWVSLSPASIHAERPSLPLEPAVISALAEGMVVTVEPRSRRQEARIYTYVPVPLVFPVTGALEISEDLSEQHAFARAVATSTFTAAVVMAFVCGTVALLFGALFVGRPVAGLVEHAERIGHGDLSSRVRPSRRDELAQLGTALNGLAENLARSRDELAREEQHRRATEERLRHADRLSTVGKLAAGIAHELGTPLNIVAGRAHMIATGEVRDEDARRSAGIVETQAQSMTRIIRELLDFARRRRPERVSTDLGRLTLDALEMVRPIGEKQAVTMRTELRTDRAAARVDPQQIRQVLGNLLINAIQAQPRGGTVAAVVERGRARVPDELGGAEAEVITVRVCDDGPGIPEELLPHLFEPFVTTKAPGEGTGLGLSVSWGLTRENGGWLTARNRPEGGAEFTLHLPTEDA